MRVDPKTEQEVEEAGLLPAGEYDFEIVDAEDTTSKKGNDMLVVTLSIADTDGRDHKVIDYLVDAVAYKVRHFASAVGVLKEYEAGNIPAHLLRGRTGKCKLRLEPAKGEFRAKNSVNDYVKDGSGNGAAPPPKQFVPKELDDDIPF